MILAYGTFDEYISLVIGVIMFAAGVAFVYADSIATRAGGVLLCIAGFLRMSWWDRLHKIEAELVIFAAIVTGVAVAVLLLFRPRWFRTRNRMPQQQPDQPNPKEDAQA
jgi:uncharacterized membrane protein